MEMHFTVAVAYYAAQNTIDAISVIVSVCALCVCVPCMCTDINNHNHDVVKVDDKSDNANGNVIE